MYNSNTTNVRPISSSMGPPPLSANSASRRTIAATTGPPPFNPNNRVPTAVVTTPMPMVNGGQPPNPFFRPPYPNNPPIPNGMIPNNMGGYMPQPMWSPNVPVTSPSMRNQPPVQNNFMPVNNNNTSMTLSTPSSSASRNRSVSIGSAPVPTGDPNEAKLFDELLTTFYSDPVRIDEISRMDLFCIRSALPKTTFEEIDIFSSYFGHGSSVDASSFGANLLLNDDNNNNNNTTLDYNNGQNSVISSLRHAIRKLYLEAFRDDDKFSASLLSYHLLLYKRLKILEKVQEFQHGKMNSTQSLKVQFEQLPSNNALSIAVDHNIDKPSTSVIATCALSSVPVNTTEMTQVAEHQYQPLKREDLDTFTKNLIKAMQKSDVKKGIFAKLRKSKSESIYKIITKYAYPLCLPLEILDIESLNPVKQYLVEYSLDKENGLKRRTKSIHSMLLLALSTGSLLDMLQVLQCLLSLSENPDDPLIDAETEDEGSFVMRAETLKPLQQFQYLIKMHLDQLEKDSSHTPGKNNDLPTYLLPQHIWNDPNYSLISFSSNGVSLNFNWKKPYLTAKRLFLFLLNQIDMLATHYLYCESYSTINSQGDLVIELGDSKNINSLLNHREKFLKNKISANIKFSIELGSPRTFSSLLDIIDSMLQIQNTSNSELNGVKNYSIAALFRILHLNVKALSLWKKGRENVNQLVQHRMSSSTGYSNVNFIESMKGYFLGFLKEIDTDLETNQDGLKSFETIHEAKPSSQSRSKDPNIKEQPKNQQKTTQDQKKDVTTNPFILNLFGSTAKEPVQEEQQTNFDIEENDDFVVISTTPGHPNNREQPPTPEEVKNVSKYRSILAALAPQTFMSKFISEKMLDILVTGFSIFYPSPEEQRFFLEDSISILSNGGKSNSTSLLSSSTEVPLRRNFLKKLLERLVNDFTLFEKLIANGIGMSDVSVVIPFTEKLLEFIKRQEQFKMAEVLSKLSKFTPEKDIKPNDIYMHEDLEIIANLVKQLMIMWQNFLFHYVHSIFSKSSVSNNNGVVNSILGTNTGKVLFEYSRLILNQSEEVLNEMCKISAEIIEVKSKVDKSSVDEVNSLLTIGICEGILQKGATGWLCFPLLLNFAKFLWKGSILSNSKSAAGNVVIESQLEKLTQFLYPPVVNLLRMIDLLCQFCDVQEFKSEAERLLIDWTIVETEHPYDGNVTDWKEVNFIDPNNNIINVGIKFDPRCITSGPEDHLRINSLQKIANLQALQFSGHGTTIPVNPLLTWGAGMSCSFKSGNFALNSSEGGKQGSMWGMRCLVVPVRSFSAPPLFMYEFSKLLGHIGGRCSTYLLSTYPYSSDEDKYVEWLESKIFANGIKGEIGQPTEQNTEKQSNNNNNGLLLLRMEEDFSKNSMMYQQAKTIAPGKFGSNPYDLIEKVDVDSSSSDVLDVADKFLLEMIEPTSNTSAPINYCNYMYQRILNKESFTQMMQQVPDVVSAERAVIAAVLKHTGLDSLARKVSDAVAESPFLLSENVDKDSYEKSMSLLDIMFKNGDYEKLKLMWRKVGRTLREWMIKTKQQKQLSYRDMRDFIVQKCKFLISLESAFMSTVPLDARDIGTTEKSSLFKKVQSPRAVEKSSLFSQQLTHNFVFNRFKKGNIGGFTNILPSDDFVGDISSQIVKFIQSDIIPVRIQNLMRMRSERALNRATSLQMFSELLQSTQFASVKAEIVHGIKAVRQNRSMKKIDSPNFHYFNNVEGSGPMYSDILSSSLSDFLKQLFYPLDSCISTSSQEEKEKQLRVLVQSGLLREILDICLISFKHNDIKWIMQFDFLEKLSYLMYNTISTPEQNTDKFKRRDGFTEEQKEINKKSWKIFRLLSIRCVEMLEENAITDPVVESQLNDLRDTVFNLLFKDLKRVIGDMNSEISSEVLEEMLSLMVSLSNTPSAQSCLSSERFQQLLLPLLRLESYPKVQELSLKLCGQLITSYGELSTDNNYSEGLKELLTILFEFLGAYETKQVTGDASLVNDKDGSGSIGMKMAKDIFNLIRKLFRDIPVDDHSSAPYFVGVLTSLMDQAINLSTQNIIQSIRKGKTSVLKDIQLVYSTLTVLNGFNCVPQIGEIVNVDMNGRVEKAKVKEIEETYHLIKIELCDKTVIHREHFVSAENVKVETNQPIEKFDLQKQHVHSLFKFITELGVMVNGTDLSLDDKILYSNLWMRSLRWLLDAISIQNNYSTIVTETLLGADSDYANMLEKLVGLGEKSTIYQTLANETNKSLITYGKDLKLDSCSFTFTGKKFHKQYYYSCQTCSMNTNQAVCAFCARTCHRGHRLGTLEVGDFYCDCGAGEAAAKTHGTSNCKSLRNASPDPILTTERMESVMLRLQKLMPISSKRNQADTLDLVPNSPNSSTASQNNQPVQKGPSKFVVTNTLVQDGVPYTINNAPGELPLITFNPMRLYSPKHSIIATDFSVPMSWPGFYFEVELVDCGESFAIGFSLPFNPTSAITYKTIFSQTQNMYTWHTEAGTLYKGNTIVKNSYPTASTKDVIGCGFIREQKTIFFTKNGVNLGPSFQNVDLITLSPIIAMKGKNVQARVNVSMIKPFQFNLPRNFKLLVPVYYAINNPTSEIVETNQPLGKPSQPVVQNELSVFETRVKELKSVVNGLYTEDDIRRVLTSLNNMEGSNLNILNFALSILHRNMQPQVQVISKTNAPTQPEAVPVLRLQLVEQMKLMGFTNDKVCLKALQLANDDINLALNYVFEGVVVEDTPPLIPNMASSSSISIPSSIAPPANPFVDREEFIKKNEKSVNDILLFENSGVPLLGSECNNSDMKQRLLKAMLQNPDMKINENNFCDSNNLREGDLVVVSPRIVAVADNNSDSGYDLSRNKKTAALSKLRGKLGVVSRKVTYGPYVMVAEEQGAGSIVTDLVESKNVYTAPHELKGITINDVPAKCLEFYMALSSTYIRTTILKALIKASEMKNFKMDLPKTFSTKKNLMKGLKLTLIDSYHHLDTDYNFISSYTNNVILEKSVDYDNNYTFANKTLPAIEHFESWKNMEITNSENKASDIFLEIEEEALNDLNAYTLGLNNYRKYDYRKDMNVLHQQPTPYKQHFIQFYGATSIAIILGEKFELPTTLDCLTFYFDRNGKKVALQIKGGTPVQDRCLIITTNNYNYFNQTEPFANQAQLYFEFTGPSVRENNGVTFYAAPYTTKLSQRDAFLQPNMLLSSLVLKYSAISRKSRKVDFTAALYFPIMGRYLLTPFAPFKGIVADALCQLDYSSPVIFNSHIDPMSHTGIRDSIVKSGPAYAHLSLLKRFRVELEDLYRKYLRYNETSPHALHNFHALTEFMTVVRKYLVSDLCQSMFPSASSSLSNLPTNLANILDKHHMYSCKLDQQHYGRTVERETLACTSCTHSVAKQLSMYETKPSSSFAKYFANESTKCQSQVAMEFQIKYDHENSCNVATSIVPIGTTSESVSKLFSKEDNLLQVNPSDWFEHVSWVDQLTIIREFLETFTSNNGRTFPEWTLFESILEKRKKVCYKESKHPYSVVNDSDKIKIPGAKTLYITFDKHSKTHKCDRLLFSTKKAGSDDLGSFGGDELKDKTIVVHGTDSVYYDFTCGGGDHDVKCSGCRSNISGVRYHCVECEEYDLCEKCVSKQGRVHSDLHLFLKIRRPVDCMPAMIPSLYTPRWRSTSQFKGNIHVGVKCDNCGVNPIKGIRYWCENCENFNLCEKCADTEFKYHDRMHIFLRVVRPLPPKNQMPANALPYGLVYEKDMDSHWGYMFSVSSSIEACPRISQVQNEIDEIRSLMKIGKDNQPIGEDDVDPVEFDKQLLEYVETYSNGWQSLEWNQLSPKKEELTNLPLLDRVPLNRLRYRFVLLKLFNRRISRVINILDFTNTSNIERMNDSRAVTITDMISQQLRDRIFYSVKMDAWQHTIMKSHVTVDPIHLKLNRHLASEMHPTDRQRNAFNSLFIQAFNQVKSMHPKILSRKQASWKVTLIGEAADDYGGPFRESLSNMCQELIANDPSVLDLFIPTPNKVSGQGDNRDKFVPTPKSTSDQHLKWYEFVGMLMGIGILTKNVLPFDYPSLIWKSLVNEKIGWTDLRSFDEEIYNAMKSILELGDVDDSDYELKSIMEDSFSQTYYGRMLTTMGSDGKEVELVPNGTNIELSYNNRKQYANLIYDYRLTKEFNSQLNAIRKGLFNMLTNRYFSLFSWHELERNVCGIPDVDVEKLKQHTIYEGYTIQSREIKHFWEIMQAFSPEQRSLFLKFVWGRGRMPYNESEAFSNPMKIQKLDRPNPDIVLPLSHTCFFSIELPSYSTKEIMKEKLLYAIINCKAIDIDFTTSAIEAQNYSIAVRR
ncbi:ubiquitin protein ligase [Naegleria gruberi]|uniref:Ubiquitin protein ligase n=1 Tax=Naegleria gruberi TaxID=5762 RepID=D2V5N7_NAEGR|nr:ubiquitin protein ligase [Naegleria gruberi]EFC47682.1 ubiquitin protein ligase [Naegleria gruberi]|eukprot:XP_002680426.1 ubiquitin protein ligase [Naegleria gruberi strain NEG-M]